MADFASLSAGFTAIQSAIDITRGLRTAASAVEKAELQFRIADLVGALTDARFAMADAQGRIKELQRELAEARKEHDIRDRLRRRGDMIFLQDGDAETGPYCQKCYDEDGKLMALYAFSGGYTVNGKSHHCLRCKNSF